MKKIFMMAIIAIATLFSIGTAARAETGTFMEIDDPGRLNWIKNICITEFSPQGDSVFFFTYVIKFGGCAVINNETAWSARQNDGALVIKTNGHYFMEDRDENPIYQTNVALRQQVDTQKQLLQNQQYQQTVAACITKINLYNSNVQDSNADSRSNAARAAESCEEETPQQLSLVNLAYRLIRDKDTGGTAPSTKDLDEANGIVYIANNFIKKCEKKAYYKATPKADPSICYSNPNYDPTNPFPSYNP